MKKQIMERKKENETKQDECNETEQHDAETGRPTVSIQDFLVNLSIAVVIDDVTRLSG